MNNSPASLPCIHRFSTEAASASRRWQRQRHSPLARSGEHADSRLRRTRQQRRRRKRRRLHLRSGASAARTAGARVCAWFCDGICKCHRFALHLLHTIHHSNFFLPVFACFNYRVEVLPSGQCHSHRTRYLLLANRVLFVLQLISSFATLLVCITTESRPLPTPKALPWIRSTLNSPVRFCAFVLPSFCMQCSDVHRVLKA
jgi:hypothetical protein